MTYLLINGKIYRAEENPRRRVIYEIVDVPMPSGYWGRYGRYRSLARARKRRDNLLRIEHEEYWIMKLSMVQ